MSYKDDFKNKVGDKVNVVKTVADKIFGNGKTIPAHHDASLPSKKQIGNVTADSMHSFDQSASAIKETYGIPGDYKMSAKLESQFINRFKVKLIDNDLAYLKCYVFIGKPDLYLFDDSSGKKMSPSIAENAEMSELIKYEPELYAQLCQDVYGNTPFLTALSNRCVGVSIQDASMGKEESGANNKGIKQVYATTYLESMVNVPTTLSFKMDRNSEVLKLVTMWCKYMEGVKEGTIFQSPEDDALNRMSYTCPIWIFACEENGVDISFYAKLTGNFPLSIPYSVFSISNDNAQVPEITVNFHTALFKPFDPLTLVEFNKLARNSTATIPRYLSRGDRDLSYYWAKGAMVSRNSKTNKLQLKFLK